MRIFKALAAIVVTSTAVLACGSPPASEGSTEASQAALSGGGVGASCGTDSSCNRGNVCEPICPVIPGRIHCEIAGGTCEPTCTRGGASLSGETFTSLDGAHSVTFNSSSSFTKTDGCPTTGIHCNHIQLTQGVYFSDGTTIYLEGNTGSFDTLSVEAHCYQGLVDDATSVELYPVAPAH
jgi:hypothetical protein